MPRSIADIARDLNDNLQASVFTTSLMPQNVKQALALAVELAEGASALEARVEDLADTFADFIAAHDTEPTEAPAV